MPYHTEKRKQLAKIMRFYAVSEEIVSALGQVEAAFSVSFATLEGLVKFVINTFEDEVVSQWLRSDLSLKTRRNHGIADAITLILNRLIPDTA